MENESFNIFLGERLRDKNVSIEKLSELSGVSIRNLESMLKGDPDKLPPAPYLHGYFVKIGDVLDFDGEEVWRNWKGADEVTSSGAADRLPKNRFSKRSVIKYIWIGVFALVVLAYGGIQLSRIMGTPSLYIDNPKAELTNSSVDHITVNGTLQNAKELYINGEAIPLADDGSWEKGISLQSGLNTIEIRAKKFLGGETTITKQVLYEPPAQATSTQATSTKP